MFPAPNTLRRVALPRSTCRRPRSSTTLALVLLFWRSRRPALLLLSPAPSPRAFRRRRTLRTLSVLALEPTTPTGPSARRLLRPPPTGPLGPPSPQADSLVLDHRHGLRPSQCWPPGQLLPFTGLPNSDTPQAITSTVSQQLPPTQVACSSRQRSAGSPTTVDTFAKLKAPGTVLSPFFSNCNFIRGTPTLRAVSPVCAASPQSAP